MDLQNGLTSLDGFPLLQTNVGGIIITGNGLQSLNGFGSLVQCQSINIGNAGLVDILGFGRLTRTTGSFIINNAVILSGFPNLTNIDLSFSITLATTLVSISGFNALITVGSSFTINNNVQLVNITGFQNLTRTGSSLATSFFLQDNIKLSYVHSFGSLVSIGGDLSIQRNTVLLSFESLSFANLTTITGALTMTSNGLTSLDGFNALISLPNILTITVASLYFCFFILMISWLNLSCDNGPIV
jgi:hypothetical protein